MYSDNPIDRVNDVIAILSFIAISLTWGARDQEYELNSVNTWGLFNMLCVCQDTLKAVITDLEQQ